MDLKQEPPDLDYEEPPEDTANNFESVWVKEEPDEDVGNTGGAKTTATATSSLTTKKTPRKRPKPTTILKCPQCDFTTVYGNSLKIHSVSHSNEKPFICSLCDFATKFEQALTRHKKFKHGERPINPKFFSCNQCEYSTVYKHNLHKHERKHRSEKEFKCSVIGCAYETAYKHHLIKHSKVHHEKVNRKDDWYQCDKCPYRAQFQGHITRHLEKIHNQMLEGAKYVCEYCQASSKDTWKLKVHKQRSIMVNAVRCIYCKFETIYKCQMQKHKKIHVNELALAQGTIFTELQPGDKYLKESYSESIGHVSMGVENGVFKCNKCAYKTVLEAEMPNHFVEVHNACKMCYFCFKDKYSLKTHEMKSKCDYPVKCSVCDFESLYKCTVRKHANVHYSELCGTTNPLPAIGGNRQIETTAITNIFNTNSTICYKTGHRIPNPNVIQKETLSTPNTNYNSMTKQVDAQGKLVENKSGKYLVDITCIDWQTIQVHESVNDVLRFRCPLCDYGSKFKASVQRHFQRHHTGNSNRPYKCMNCDLSVKTKDAISKHNGRTYSSEPLTCKICSFTTNYRCSYTAHQKLHYTYKCNVCNHNYRTKYDLIRHVDEKHLRQGLKCRFCEFVASRKESLICHETIHTGVKPFRCSVCGYSSIRRTLLEAHIKKYHARDPTAVCETLAGRAALSGVVDVPPTVLEEPAGDCNEDPTTNKPDPEVTQGQGEGQDDSKAISDDEVIEVNEEPLKFEQDAENIEVKFDLDLDIPAQIEDPCSSFDYEFLDTAWDAELDENDLKQESDIKDQLVTMTYACDHCEYTSPISDELARHIKRKHTIEKRFKCLKCPFKTSHRVKFVKHCKKHNKTKVFQCRKCSFRTKYKLRMKRHSSTAHVKWECEYCGVLFAEKHLLKLHQKNSMFKNPRNCTICEFISFYKCALKKHKKTHVTEIHDVKYETVKIENKSDDSDESSNSEVDVLKCDKCTFETNNEKKLTNHIVKEHNGCKHCNRSFDSKADYKDHVRNNKFSEKEVCMFCDFDSHYTCEVRKHMCAHFSEEFEPEDFKDLEERIVAALDSIEALAAIEDADEQKPNILESKMIPEGHKLRKNKFGQYLVDLNCIDRKTFRVKRSGDRNRPFQCPACVFTTKFSNSIKRHIQRNHFDETYRPYKCINCDFSTTTTDGIARHNQRKRSKITLHCGTCKYKTKNRCAYSLHQRTHYMYKCRCKRSFEKPGSLISHFATTHLGRRFKCQYCDYVAMTKETVSNHEMKHTGMRMFLCNICGYKSSRRQIIDDHFKRHHNGEPKGVKIEIEDIFEGNNDINDTKYDISETVICNDCGYTAPDKLLLVGHIRRKHSQQFMCDECGFTTTYKGSLKTHSMTHKKSTVFKCKKCPFETTFKGHMIRHIQALHGNIMETKITRDVCDYCNKKQKSYYLRKKHQSQSRSEKPFTCEMCGFETFYRCQIEVHIQNHNESTKDLIETAVETDLYTEECNEDNLLKCRFCDFLASKQELLKCHEAGHTGEKPFKCNLCEYSTTTRALLFVHWKKYHGGGLGVPRRKNKKRIKTVSQVGNTGSL